MNLSDATAVYVGADAASAVYITDAAGTATKVWPTAAPSPYPASGTYTTANLDDFQVAATHTITEAGTFTITNVLNTWTSYPPYTGIRVNGTPVAGEDTYDGPSVTWTGALAVGAVVGFSALTFGGTGSGTWTVTKV